MYIVSTPKFNNVSSEDMKSLNVVDHIWKTGDRYYKLADQYYKDPSLWWIIAWFNLHHIIVMSLVIL